MDPALYGIDPLRGFLPPQDPLQSLPAAYQCWDHAIKELPHYLLSGSVRTHLDQLPLLPVSGLNEGPEMQRAYSVVSILCHGYVWGLGEDKACSVLPRNLAVPWAELAKRLGIAPIMTHAAVVLWNWRRIDPNGSMDLSNLACLSTLAGGLDEAWFFLVTVDIEAKGAKAVKAIIDIINDMAANKEDTIITHMDSIAASIHDMTNSLRRMYEHCDPHMFFTKIRLSLAGWKNNPSLPNGLIYEGVSKEPFLYSGGSAAQSSAVQAIDIALGVTHEPVPDKEAAAKDPASCPVTGQVPSHLSVCPVRKAGHDEYFLMEMRKYMPGKDRAFLEALERAPKIKDFVMTLGQKDPNVIAAYNRAVDALTGFRSFHIQIVTMYIVTQANKARGNSSLNDRGTGGTSPVVFLKHVRDETKVQVIPEGQTQQSN